MSDEKAGLQPENSSKVWGTPFKPGESGNPSGRPKGSVSIVAALRRLMESGDPNYSPEKAAQILWQHFQEGNSTAINAVLDRLEGKLKDSVGFEGKLIIKFEDGTNGNTSETAPGTGESLDEPETL